MSLGLPGLSLFGQPRCVCGVLLDPVGTHTPMGVRGSTATHDDIHDVLVVVMRDAWYHVAIEQGLILPLVDGVLDP